MFDSRAVILARFDGGLTWPEIRVLFAGKRKAREFVMVAEDDGLLSWQVPPRKRGVLRGRGRWSLTTAGRAFVRESAEGTA